MRTVRAMKLALPCSVLVAAATLLRPALAGADPTPEAQSKMALALSACDRGLGPDGDAVAMLPEYRARLDEAKRLDASIASWSGQLHGVWIVNQWVPKCERELPAKANEARYRAAIDPAIDAAYDACVAGERDQTQAALAQYQRARAALTAANGGRAAFTYPPNPPIVAEIAKCDRGLAPAVAAADKQRARDKAEAQQREAEKKAAQAKVDALWATLHGDRAAVARDYGLPPMKDQDMPRAASWVYQGEAVRGQVYIDGPDGKSAKATRTVPCTITFVFKGDKKVSRKNSVSGCEP